MVFCNKKIKNNTPSSFKNDKKSEQKSFFFKITIFFELSLDLFFLDLFL